MKQKDSFHWNGYEMNKAEAWVVYQDLCDEVFGEDVVDIDSVDSNNAVLMHLMFVNQYEAFYHNLKAMLERLKEKMESKDAMDLLIDTVERVADPYSGEQAYAQLVTWEVLWNAFDADFADLTGLAVDVMYDIDSSMNCYKQAEEHKHMVMEKFAIDVMYRQKHVVVLVKAPWNNNNNDWLYAIGAFCYYRNLARRTFMEYLNDEDTGLWELNDDYCGEELVQDFIGQLNGIVVIDMVGSPSCDKVVCHSYVNPNSDVMTKKDRDVLLCAPLCGEGTGEFDSFEFDCY